MKIAVVGSGAAAVGVLRAIEEWCPDAETTLVDRGEEAIGRFFVQDSPEREGTGYNRRLYRYLRSSYGLKFPPPKTNFGLEPAKLHVPDWGAVWQSRTFGGLTNFWGASSLPFTDEDMRDWPIGAADLAPYYRRMADQIGLSGCRDDVIGTYLGEEFISRPPILRPPVFDKLEATINDAAARTPYRLVAGASRLALETRPDRPDCCDYSGGCMTGCSAGAIYGARRDIERLTRSGRIARTIRAKALAVMTGPTRLRVETPAGIDHIGPFDRIYLCAGCIGSTEIVMRSLGWRDGPMVTDNAVYTFPIVYLGKPLPTSDADRHFGLSNLLAFCLPDRIEGRAAMIQAYPNVDYLWRYYLPVAIWPLFQPFGRAFRRRLIWGRVFVHGDYSQRYALALPDRGDLELSLARRPWPLKKVPGLWPSIRRSIRGHGFWLPPVPPVRHATSSHYAASLPLGIDPVSPDGEFLAGAYICDSATFTDSPAASPTLSIMANACRIAHRSLSLSASGQPLTRIDRHRNSAE